MRLEIRMLDGRERSYDGQSKYVLEVPVFFANTKDSAFRHTELKLDRSHTALRSRQSTCRVRTDL